MALIRERTSLSPLAAVVLGSGLSGAVEEDIEPEAEFTFEALPGFPPPTVPGHPGRVVLGRLFGVPVAAFLGRIHLYEGHGMAAVTLVPRVASALGARVLMLTNTSGGLATGTAGRIMLIEDHINRLGSDPLFGWRQPGGEPAFVDLSNVYEPGLRALTSEAADGAGVDLLRGVYVAVAGPSYETPAETAALAALGAHAVGMSTVPEAVAGVALGMRILGLSCITDVAGTPLVHEDVLAAAVDVQPALRSILSAVLARLAKQ